MSWLTRILGTARQLRARTFKTFDYWDNKYVASGGFMSPESASGHAVALRCIQTIAENLAMVPLRLYRRTDDGGRRRRPCIRCTPSCTIGSTQDSQPSRGGS